MTVSELTSLPDDTGPLEVLPGIGVGPVVDPIASITVSHVARYRMRTDRAGLSLRAGEVESPLVPHEQTLRLLRQMDGLRGQIGVRYAADA